MQDFIVSDKLYIDIDVLYEDFFESVIWQRFKVKLPYAAVLVNAVVVSLMTRPSSNGNAHVEIRFNRPITFFEGLSVRSWIGDDEARIILDLSRYLRTGDQNQVNRLWAGKYKRVDVQSELKLAGLWEKHPIPALDINADRVYINWEHFAQCWTSSSAFNPDIPIEVREEIFMGIRSHLKRLEPQDTTEHLPYDTLSPASSQSILPLQ